MLSKITPEFLSQITNPAFKDNARIYTRIESNYLEQIESFGLSFEDTRTGKERAHSLGDPGNPQVAALCDKGIVVANDTKSLHLNRISPACETCRRGLGSLTFTISMRCPRNCFFCFNPNQDNYEQLQQETNDVVADLRELHTRKAGLTDIALTGGEPLLFKDETEEFFRVAKELFPEAYTRLYTSGAFLDEAYLEQLAAAGLDEIRFSIKTDDPPATLQQTLDLIKLSCVHIKQVMVEMPVMPDEVEVMQNLLVSLDEIGISGINLLELCFPMNNADEFVRRGYRLKREQLRVLYNYWYAAGLPIAGSEEACLELLDFAAERELTIGVHYCSLENKFSGQIYQLNAPEKHNYPYCVFSERDYFLKSAKVYGRDAARVAKSLAKRGLKRFRHDKFDEVLEFLPGYLESLAPVYPDLEVAISYHVVERDEQGAAFRELRLDHTTPSTFDATKDL